MPQDAKRILLKLSGEYLGGPKGQGFDFQLFDQLALQLLEIRAKGFELAIVLGGGNFFRGAASLPIPMDRVAADQIGMLATVMNSMVLKETLISHGQPARVMTGLNIPAVAEPFDKRRATQALSTGDILIFGGGTGNPFFSTDTAAALRALEIEADWVVKGTMVDGVYDKDPKKHSDAKKYTSLTFSDALKHDLKVMDAAAIALCRENNLPIGVVNIGSKTDLLDFLSGKEVGSTVH